MESTTATSVFSSPTVNVNTPTMGNPVSLYVFGGVFTLAFVLSLMLCCYFSRDIFRRRRRPETISNLEVLGIPQIRNSDPPLPFYSPPPSYSAASSPSVPQYSPAPAEVGPSVQGSLHGVMVMGSHLSDTPPAASVQKGGFVESINGDQFLKRPPVLLCDTHLSLVADTSEPMTRDIRLEISPSVRFSVASGASTDVGTALDDHEDFIADHTKLFVPVPLVNIIEETDDLNESATGAIGHSFISRSINNADDFFDDIFPMDIHNDAPLSADPVNHARTNDGRHIEHISEQPRTILSAITNSSVRNAHSRPHITDPTWKRPMTSRAPSRSPSFFQLPLETSTTPTRKLRLNPSARLAHQNQHSRDDTMDIMLAIPGVGNVMKFEVTRDVNLTTFSDRVRAKLGFAVAFTGTPDDCATIDSDTTFKSFVDARLDARRRILLFGQKDWTAEA